MVELYWKKVIKSYWVPVLIALGCFVCSSAAGLTAPIIIKVLIDNALLQGSLGDLHLIIAGVIFLYLLRGIFYYAYSYTMAKTGNKLIAKLRQQMFSKLLRLDYKCFLEKASGDYIALFTNDLWLIQQAVLQGVPDILVESLNLLAIMSIMIFFNWELALVTFVAVPFIIVTIGYFNRKIGYLGILLENALEKITEQVNESLRAVLTIQSYVREEYECKKFNLKSQQAAEEFLATQKVMAALIPLVEFLAAIGLTIIIWYGGREVINGKLTMGGMFAFLVYIINLPAPVRKISEAVTRLKLGSVAWERIEAFQRVQNDIVDGEKELESNINSIAFDSVFFQYDKRQSTLYDVNFAMNRGDVWAIVGPSGAGKSSIIYLLMRFYDPEKGEIRIGGQNIKDFTFKSLRQHMGFIQQEPLLFNTTIMENIRYGKIQASDDEVYQVACEVGMHEFINALPRGYKTIVGEDGNQLSGGQRQKIALARAIISDPAILILDEPTASLDAQSAQQVMEAIRRTGVGRTTIIVTHQPSLLNDSDQIIYLDHGRVMEQGTQKKLLMTKGFYATFRQQ